MPHMSVAARNQAAILSSYVTTSLFDWTKAELLSWVTGKMKIRIYDYPDLQKGSSQQDL
jgi:hypothetical protein